MPNVSLTYDSQIADADRRQRLAQALQQQANDPITINRYQGIAAMPSPYEALAKILKQVGANRQEKRASDERSAASTQDQSAAQAALAAALGGGGSPTQAPSPPPGILAALQGQGPQGAPQKQFDPTMAQPPQTQPMAPQQAPMDPRAMMLSGLQMGIGGGPASQQAGQQIASLGQSQMAQQQAQQAADLKAARDLAQHNAEREADARTANAAKDAEKAQDLDRARAMVQSIRAQVKDPSQQAALDAAAQAGTAAVQPLLTEIMRTPTVKYRPATADELKPYPPGTTGQVNEQTGQFAVVYNPHDDRVADQQLQLERQRVGLEAQRVAQGAAGGGSGQWTLTPEETAALNKAAGENRVDAAKLNSRTAKITAGVLLANPNINLMNNHGIANLLSSGSIQQKLVGLNALPQVLENVRDAGKKLNFSNLAPIGAGQAAVANLTNNPDFRNYMTQRNDAMMSISAVMRLAGMSDKSIELEERAAPPAMSPRAFEAWYEAQINSLTPRIQGMAPYTLAPPANMPGGTGTAPPGAAPAPARVGTYNPATGRVDYAH